mmetsp:Transcript_23335/g.24857  ORF Transcript_23335/g.24857 Transcript_23335/m.24857 type:complete len:201 (+) Transcript_23335:748-1350(+)
MKYSSRPKSSPQISSHVFGPPALMRRPSPVQYPASSSVFGISQRQHFQSISTRGGSSLAAGGGDGSVKQSYTSFIRNRNSTTRRAVARAFQRGLIWATILAVRRAMSFQFMVARSAWPMLLQESASHTLRKISKLVRSTEELSSLFMSRERSRMVARTPPCPSLRNSAIAKAWPTRTPDIAEKANSMASTTTFSWQGAAS